jgi:hypothetical protein
MGSGVVVSSLGWRRAGRMAWFNMLVIVKIPLGWRVQRVWSPVHILVIRVCRRGGGCSQRAFQREGASKEGRGFCFGITTCRHVGQEVVLPRPLFNHFWMQSCPKMCLHGRATGWWSALKGSVQMMHLSAGRSCVLMKSSMVGGRNSQVE